MKPFDHQGQDLREIEVFCCYGRVRRGRARWVYWPPEIYSFGRHIRDYASYPSWLPLMVYSDHGAGPYYDGIPPHELNSGAYCQFYHSPDNVEAFRKISERPCYTMLSPFVHYRRRHQIEQTPDARGTLVYFSHSTSAFEVKTNLERYIEELRRLPEKYHPICISIHMHDVENGVHRYFMEQGFPVYTAGNPSDQRFAERFYELLRHFRYTTSNSPGSHTFYSVEMGIPYFSYGDEPDFYNQADPNYALGKYSLQGSETYRHICELFSELKDEVTPEQKHFAEYHLGVYDCVKPEEMHRLLWEAYKRDGKPLADLWFQINLFRYAKKALKFLIDYFRQSTI